MPPGGSLGQRQAARIQPLASLPGLPRGPIHGGEPRKPGNSIPAAIGVLVLHFDGVVSRQHRRDLAARPIVEDQAKTHAGRSRTCGRPPLGNFPRGSSCDRRLPDLGRSTDVDRLGPRSDLGIRQVGRCGRLVWPLVLLIAAQRAKPPLSQSHLEEGSSAIAEFRSLCSDQ